MTIVTLDVATGTRLLAVTGEAELRDEAGQLLGFFNPVVQQDKSTYDGCYIPDFSQEELQALLSQPRGRTLKDILADLEKRL